MVYATLFATRTPSPSEGGGLSGGTHYDSRKHGAGNTVNGGSGKRGTEQTDFSARTRNGTTPQTRKDGKCRWLERMRGDLGCLHLLEIKLLNFVYLKPQERKKCLLFSRNLSLSNCRPCWDRTPSASCGAEWPDCFCGFR